jgi:NADH-quinone oxidoreductase subunit F
MDNEPVDTKLAPYLQGGRDQLLPALWTAQRLYGYISEDTAKTIARALAVPASEVFGVLEFYEMFSTEPAGRRVIRVCTGPVCRAKGATDLLAGACAAHDIDPGQVTADGELTIESSPCLGLCDGAPAALSAQTPVFDADAGGNWRWVESPGAGPTGHVGGATRRKLSRCADGVRGLPAYLDSGGYQGLRRALHGMTPAEVIDEIKESKLVGRGGAAFPTGLKWQFTAEAPAAIRYVVANGDESEPGTFKDRVLMENDPFAVLEGMAIAGYAIGAPRGYLYIRGEYPRAQTTMAKAIDAAREAGLLGAAIDRTDFSFDIVLRSGAGAYICGEETALFESIEGKRGHPRIKPPFPTTNGLFGQPTVINNIETLSDVTWILANGADAYREQGTDESAGTKLFCLSGDVQNPGVYEFPFGIAMGDLIDAAGGVVGDLQAVLLGGAAGTFATPEQLDLPMSFEGLRSAGLSLGSGAVMVFNQSRPLDRILLYLAEFFAHESCGKCLPCQLGTQRQLEILKLVADGSATPTDLRALRDVIYTMTHDSLCGLGVTAGVAVESALDRWPDHFPAAAESGAEGGS